MKILVLHGPNLNLLGEREPEHYGTLTLARLDAQLRESARALGHELKIFQSNHEGALLDKLHAERRWMEGLVINAGAYTHTSYALRDGIAAVGARTIEVHLSNIKRREAWRRKSVIEEVCEAQLCGKGVGSYLEALEQLAAPPVARREPRERRATSGPVVRKTIGRKTGPRPGLESPHRSKSATTTERAGKTTHRKTLGRGGGARRADELSRPALAEKLRDRLSGSLSARALVDWAKGRFLAMERGELSCAPADEAELRDALLLLAAGGLSEDALVGLLARLS